MYFHLADGSTKVYKYSNSAMKAPRSSWVKSGYEAIKGTIQRAPHMRVISVYLHLNLCKSYNGPIRLLANHDFTVRCIQVESIARGRWMVPLKTGGLAR